MLCDSSTIDLTKIGYPFMQASSACKLSDIQLTEAKKW